MKQRTTHQRSRGSTSESSRRPFARDLVRSVRPQRVPGGACCETQDTAEITRVAQALLGLGRSGEREPAVVGGVRQRAFASRLKPAEDGRARGALRTSWASPARRLRLAHRVRRAQSSAETDNSLRRKAETEARILRGQQKSISSAPKRNASSNPPTSSNTSRRNPMFAPMAYDMRSERVAECVGHGVRARVPNGRFVDTAVSVTPPTRSQSSSARGRSVPIPT